MAIDAVSRGANTAEVAVVGDPSNASNNLNVGTGHAADASNLGVANTSLTAAAVPMLLNAAGTFDRAREAPGAVGVPSVNTEGTKATNSYATSGLTPAATATDIVQISGSASKVVRVTRISVSGLATAAATLDLLLVRRSAANTGGTSTSLTAAQHDTNDVAPTAAVIVYTANPAGLGASAGTVRGAKLNLGAAGSAGTVTWDFTVRNAKGVILRGTAQQLCLNLNGQTIPAGASLDIDVEATEE